MGVELGADGGDLANEDLEVNNGADLGNEVGGEGDNAANEADNEVEDSAQLNTDNSENLSLELGDKAQDGLDLSDESLNADEEVEDELDIGGNKSIGVDKETLQLGKEADEDIDVSLEINDDLEEGLGIDVGIDIGAEVGC